MDVIEVNMLTQLREKRNRLWNETKEFLANHRDENGMVPSEYLAIYDRMTADVKKLGEEIKRLEEQVEIDRLVNTPQKEPEIVLKRCPWCGNYATLQKHDMGRPGGHGYPGNTEVYVECVNEKCRATVPCGKYDDISYPLTEAIKKAVSAWNNRAD